MCLWISIRTFVLKLSSKKYIGDIGGCFHFRDPSGDNGSSGLLSKQSFADAIWDASVDHDVFVLFLSLYR